MISPKGPMTTCSSSLTLLWKSLVGGPTILQLFCNGQLNQHDQRKLVMSVGINTTTTNKDGVIECILYARNCSNLFAAQQIYEQVILVWKTFLKMSKE